ncbi:MAG: hypothetical protein ABSA47_11755 [Verrucomicrobiota bacterium]|jgi:hypothetical protein
MNLSAENIDKILSRLNRKMVYADVKPLNVAVCGGTALIAVGLVSRATEDVDIIALLRVDQVNIEVLAEKSLPADVERLVAEIGIELHIREDWFNFHASPLVAFGFPPNMTNRLIKKSYGACLTVYFINRFDQVHFKMYAAMDPKDGTRHLGDLLDLKPKEHEVRAAVSWLLGREASPEFKAALRQVLERIGYERISEQI